MNLLQKGKSFGSFLKEPFYCDRLYCVCIIILFAEIICLCLYKFEKHVVCEFDTFST
uniref:Uncharacterized protein n=1 Tax=Nelumbo nucifera TaxID=4432 RepID=A0A822Y538_NELNU|nr:TPA_asm: hypothetical protein HUJ06_027907 [Nelumbo nucifera]